jgi:hypothetical protein
MKALFLTISFWLILFPVETEAETRENPLPRCRQLAYDFAENPDSLKNDQLKQLQFCINQTLDLQEATNLAMMLKGTIIEPLSPSAGDPLQNSPELPAPD